MRKPLAALIALALPADVAALFAAQALAATRGVKVGDDYFVRKDAHPTITVHKGTKVTWRWTGDNLHNVSVAKGPVKFRSNFKSSGTYSRTLRTTGTYTIVCTIHQADMTMKVRVIR